MDYHSIHGHDISNFHIPGGDRLPTIAASQALDQLQHEPAQSLSTGLKNVDCALGGLEPDISGDCKSQEGLRRGQVTEVWGPPGAGKTALAIQTAARAICRGQNVVWVDCFQCVDRQRVINVIEAVKVDTSQNDSAIDEDVDRFTHYSCLTLAHLMALISRPLPNKTWAGASLIVISSVSALLNSSYSKVSDDKTRTKIGQGPTASAKRLHALQYVINALQKLAATQECAVMVLSQCATKVQSEQGASLVAAVNASVWEQGVATRLVMYRDWTWQKDQLASIFAVGLQKIDGAAVGDVDKRVAGFVIRASGIVETVDDAPMSSRLDEPQRVAPLKRKRAEKELEVPDSDDDDDDAGDNYGWVEGDEAAMPAPPPQWQGSEDLLLGQDIGRSDDSAESLQEGTDEAADDDDDHLSERSAQDPGEGSNPESNEEAEENALQDVV